MNTPYFDIAADKDEPSKSCTSYDNKGVQRKIEKEFDKGLYKDYTDIFGKENSQTQSLVFLIEMCSRSTCFRTLVI